VTKAPWSNTTLSTRNPYLCKFSFSLFRGNEHFRMAQRRSQTLQWDHGLNYPSLL